MKTRKATFAIYRTRDEIRMAVRTLLRLGFKNKNLSVLQPIRNGGGRDFPNVQKNQLQNGAIFGAILGAFVAGTVYLFLNPSLSDSSFVRSSLAVFGIMILGALAGIACGALVGIGTPDPVAKRYGQYMHSGGILLSVESDSPEQAVRAEHILTATGGHDVHIENEKVTWDSAIMENIQISHAKPFKNLLSLRS